MTIEEQEVRDEINRLTRYRLPNSNTDLVSLKAVERVLNLVYRGNRDNEPKIDNEYIRFKNKLNSMYGLFVKDIIYSDTDSIKVIDETIKRALGVKKYAVNNQEPTHKVSLMDEDHIWYEGRQYISLRRFLELKNELKTGHCKWIKYDYRTICPSEHDVDNPYWRIPEEQKHVLKYCPYCGSKIKIVEN